MLRLARLFRNFKLPMKSQPLAKPFTIDVPGVGPVLMAPSRRAGRLVLSIRPFKGIRLAIPAWITRQQATAFLHNNRSWLQAHLPRIQKMETRLAAQATLVPPVDKDQAHKKLTLRLAELAQSHNFTYNRVTMRNQKTRWGSCSADNNISLNIKLMALPDDLRDYVLLHELLHTRIKNHSPAFWAELGRLVDDVYEKRKRLKGYHLALI